MIYVIATTEVKPGKREAFLKEMRALVPKVRAEHGCVFYHATIDAPSGLSAQTPVNENLITMLECWESLDALKAHLGQPHMAEYRTATVDMVVKKSLNIVKPA